jgi:very-short-patch-repair endonuclease
MVIHRSSRAVDALHPTLLPPRTRIDETVIDLINQAGTFDKAFATATAACQRGLVKPELLVMAMGKRKKLRWRVELGEALQQIKAGIHSMLEYRYLHLVERPHRLPTADRQARISTEDRRRYLDNLYREYRLCVELDGQSAHPDQQRWEDLRRINAIAAIGITTLRYGWADINNWPCQTAGQIAVVLNRLGWPGTVRRCAPGCLAPLAAAREAGRRRS